MRYFDPCSENSANININYNVQAFAPETHGKQA